MPFYNSDRYSGVYKARSITFDGSLGDVFMILFSENDNRDRVTADFNALTKRTEIVTIAYAQIVIYIRHL